MAGPLIWVDTSSKDFREHSVNFREHLSSLGSMWDYKCRTFREDTATRQALQFESILRPAWFDTARSVLIIIHKHAYVCYRDRCTTLRASNSCFYPPQIKIRATTKQSKANQTKPNQTKPNQNKTHKNWTTKRITCGKSHQMQSEAHQSSHKTIADLVYHIYNKYNTLYNTIITNIIKLINIRNITNAL
jgi:hypothetical protein